VEAINFLDTIFNDWKIIAGAFAIGGFYFQAKMVVKKIMSALENTSTTHAAQNVILDNISDKLEGLDKRIARLEGTMEMVRVENNDQSVRLSVIETRQDIEHTAPKRRARIQ